MTYKLHQITGEEIPDEEARVELRKYLNPRTATWPAVDFIVGNPPFIGKGALIRESLGDGYVEALSDAWKNVPKSCDFVMYWWEKYAQLAASNKIKRFGLITTNSIGQTFNRRIIERWLKNTKPISFAFAIPDHPWIKVSDKADVRIAMTVGEAGNQIGTLHEVISEADLSTDTPRINFSANNGKIQPDLTLGTDVTSTQSTKSNSRISWNGVMLAASGFLLTPDQKARMIFSTSRLLRPFLHGKYLTKKSKWVSPSHTLAQVIALGGGQPKTSCCGGGLPSDVPRVRCMVWLRGGVPGLYPAAALAGWFCLSPLRGGRRAVGDVARPSALPSL